MTNGSEIIPSEAINMTSERLIIGIHLKLLKSCPDFLKYE